MLPIFDTKDSSTRDKIISILATEPGINTKRISASLKKQYALNVTYQAVHKTLKQMVEQEVLAFDGKSYMINEVWVNNLKKFVEKIAKRDESFTSIADINYEEIIKSGKQIKFILANRKEFDEFYYNIRKHMIENLKALDIKDRIVFRSFWHLYYPLTRPKEEMELIDLMKKTKAKDYTFVIGDTPLDAWAAKIYKDSPVQVILGEMIASTNMIFIYGNVIMDIYYDYKSIELFDNVFNNIKNLDSLSVVKAVENLYSLDEPIIVSINSDPALVTILKKLFIHNLTKHNVFISSHNYDQEFEKLLNSPLMKETIKHELGKDVEVVKRKSNMFIIKAKVETGHNVKRILAIAPEGYTSNKIDYLNCHPEARNATILVKGGIRPENNGFIKLKDAIKFSYYLTKNIEGITDFSEAKINYESELYRESLKSSNEKFYVVKNDGEGFFHNLINLSKEWVILILNKELNDEKKLMYQDLINKMNPEEKKLASSFVTQLKKEGDSLFYSYPELINSLIHSDPKTYLPFLVNLLNIPETGKHEQCTVFAIILKIGRINYTYVLSELEESLNNELAPGYYLRELITKLKKDKRD